MGSSGTGGHPPPGPRAGQCPLLLWNRLQQKRDGNLRRTGNDRGGLRLLPLWGRDRYGQPRPARPVVRRDARRNAIDKRDRNGLGFDLPIPHPEFPTSTSNSGIVWPNGEYTPPGIPPSAPLTPDDLASEFCRYFIPAPKCTCQNSSKVLDPYPDKARSICIDFLKKYQFSAAVISTALCLVNAEETVSRNLVLFRKKQL